MIRITNWSFGRYMYMSRRTRRAYAALTPLQQADVDAMLAPEIAKGWIPKDADIQAAIDIVLDQDRTRYPKATIPKPRHEP